MRAYGMREGSRVRAGAEHCEFFVAHEEAGEMVLHRRGSARQQILRAEAEY